MTASARARTYDEDHTKKRLAKNADLFATDAGDALEEGLLPRLQLDQLHAFERLGGGVDASVLHLHELTLNGGEACGHVPGERDHEQDDHCTCQSGVAELCIRRGWRNDLIEEHDERDDDLEGTGPDGLEVAGSEKDAKRLRCDVLELLTVHFHEIHNPALIELGSSRRTETESFVVSTDKACNYSIHHGNATRAKTQARTKAKVEVVT